MLYFSRDRDIFSAALFLSIALLLSACDSDADCSETAQSCSELHIQRCSSESSSVETCMPDVQGCMLWTQTGQCERHDRCAVEGGAAICECAHECEQPGQSSCSTSMRQLCLVDAFGCKYLADDRDCASSSQICTEQGGEARCAGSCQDACAQQGQTRCQGMLMQACVVGDEGCLVWQVAQNCEQLGLFCSESNGAAACSTTCSDQCSDANLRCRFDWMQRCEAGSSGCLEWHNALDCAQSNQTCDDSNPPAKCVSTCVADCGNAGVKRCQGHRVQTCEMSSMGCLTWQDDVDCAQSGQSCTEAGSVVVCANTGGGAPLCGPCTAHSQCSGYTGQYGGRFCQPLAEGQSENFCLQDCTNDAALCGSDEICDAAGNCVPSGGCASQICSTANPQGNCPAGQRCDAGVCLRDPSSTPVGAACGQNDACSDSTAQCYPETSNGEDTGFLNGYCMVFDCNTAGCPDGSSCVEVSQNTQVCLDNCLADAECRPGYGCLQGGGGASVCFPSCDASSCPGGYACQDGQCVTACTPGSCPDGQVCSAGRCVTDVGAGPGSNGQFSLGQLGSLCPDLPPLQCSEGAAICDAIEAFTPVDGPGYENYPINGETLQNQYRSYLRHDAQMMIKYAAAYVACLAADWTPGNGGRVGLGDMSEQDGAIPGTSIGSPGHPEGTHVNGHDLDIGYFQVDTPDNRLRPICDHYSGGQDVYHCTAPPHLLDPWRSALFAGALFNHPDLRIIGVDGQAGEAITSALQQLCAGGWLSSYACSRGNRLTYEVTDEGRGWYRFHHHHMHVSFSQPSYSHVDKPEHACLIPNCDGDALDRFLTRRAPLKSDPLGAKLDWGGGLCLP